MGVAGCAGFVGARSVDGWFDRVACGSVTGNGGRVDTWSPIVSLNQAWKRVCCWGRGRGQRATCGLGLVEHDSRGLWEGAGDGSAEVVVAAGESCAGGPFASANASCSCPIECFFAEARRGAAVAAAVCAVLEPEFGVSAGSAGCSDAQGGTAFV